MDPLIQILLVSVLSPAILLFGISRIFNVGELHQKFKTALADIKELKNTLKDLSEKVIVMKTCLVNTFGIEASLFSSSSPLALRPKGEKLLRSSGFKGIYGKNKKLFIGKIRAQKPKTKADIDEASILIMEELKDRPLLIGFKETVFESGIPMEVLLRVCAIHLREKAIEELL